jgi:hypothetical protein
MKWKISLFLSLLIAACSYGQGAAFTYQGQLNNNGVPANGNYNFTFSLFSKITNGIALAGPVTNNGVNVSNGLFTVAVDFGTNNTFTGVTNWLQIGVTTNGSTSFIALVPRQQITPVPYSSYATASGSVFSGIGSPVGVFFPAAPTAIYFDNTIPADPAMWVWANSTWTEEIGN